MKRILFTGFVVIALITTVITFYHNWPLGSASEANPNIKLQAVIESDTVRKALISLESNANTTNFKTFDYSEEVAQDAQMIIDSKLTRPDAINVSMEIYRIWNNMEDRSKVKSEFALKNEEPFFALLSNSITRAKIDISPESQEHLSNAEVFLGYKYLERDNTDEGFKWLTRAGLSGDRALKIYLDIKARRESNQPP